MRILNTEFAGTVEFKLASGEVYSVEELLGMIFSHAKKQAEDFTDQKVKVGSQLILQDW